MQDILQQDLQYLPGVGPQRKRMLNEELGIQTYGDLLQYYPYKHVDRSRLYSIRELTGDMPFVQVKGHILSFEGTRGGSLHGRQREGDGPDVVQWRQICQAAI